jgi:hypothetical protein
VVNSSRAAAPRTPGCWRTRACWARPQAASSGCSAISSGRENTARLIEAGFRIALTRSEAADDEWASCSRRRRSGLPRRHERGDGSASVVDFLLRDRDNPSSVLSAIEAARQCPPGAHRADPRGVGGGERMLDDPEGGPGAPGARARPARGAGADPPAERWCAGRCTARCCATTSTTSPDRHLHRTRRQHRADPRREVLRPAALDHASRTSSLDNVQWETILRSVSAPARLSLAQRARSASPSGIADFLILDGGCRARCDSATERSRQPGLSGRGSSLGHVRSTAGRSRRSSTTTTRTA